MTPDSVEAWLRANQHRPFFLFVHTYDVHDRCPFVPPGSGEFGAWPELSDERQAALQQHYRDLIAEAKMVENAATTGSQKEALGFEIARLEFELRRTVKLKKA